MKYLTMFLVLLILPSVIANVEYNETGNFNNYYNLGTGFFNSQLTEIDSFTRAIDSKQVPLVSDLDGDGSNEIIVIDGGTIRLYENKELDVVDSFNIVDEELSNMIIFDIDDDGFNEIIVAMANSELLKIIEYNGSEMIEQQSYDLSSLNHDSNADMMIKCKGIEECGLFYSNKTAGGGQAGRIYGTFFDSGSLGTETSLLTGSWANAKFCFSHIKSMQVADYDNDGIDEYVLSTIENDASAQLKFYIIYVNSNKTGTKLNYEMDIDSTTSSFAMVSASCRDEDARAFTDPLVFDFDGSPSNGLETVIGFMKDSDEFKIYSYQSDGGFLDDYPEAEDADGILVSNMILANAFHDTGLEDFCTMGYQADLNLIDLTCASELTAETPETAEYTLDISSYYNISDNLDIYNNMIHSAQHSTETTEGNNLDEIVSSYGILELDWESCNIFGDCDLNLIFENPQEDSAVISIDYDKVGREDLLLITSTNLWYLDDGFTNTPGEIASYTINPCLDSTWKENTTVNVQIQVTDVDGDNVNAEAMLYYNHANMQREISTNASVDTTFSLSFVANQTIGTGTLRLIGRDVENFETNDTIDLSFSVSSNGVEFGDCITTVDIITSAEAEEEDLTEPSESNAITNSLEDIDSLFNLNIGTRILWLIFMVIVAYAIWVTKSSMDGSKALGVILIVESLLLIIGTILGIFGTGLIIVMSIIGIIVISMFIKKLFTSEKM